MGRTFEAISLAAALALGMASQAHAEDSVAPIPIPAVVAGTVDLQEIKPTLSVDVKSSQSRHFRTKKKIVRVSVSDPSIAEPVVVSEHEFLLLGKSPGNVSVVIWTE